jgi:hypothetical protein
MNTDESPNQKERRVSIKKIREYVPAENSSIKTSYVLTLEQGPLGSVSYDSMHLSKDEFYGLIRALRDDGDLNDLSLEEFPQQNKLNECISTDREGFINAIELLVDLADRGFIDLKTLLSTLSTLCENKRNKKGD